MLEWLERKLMILDDDLPKHADAYVGFACDISEDMQSPSPQSQAVVLKGSELFKKGVVDYIIFTGGNPPYALRKEAELMREALNSSVPPDRILIEKGSHTTPENAINTLYILHTIGAKTVIVGAQYWHARRVRATCQKLWTDSGITFFVVKAFAPYGGGTQKRFKTRARFMFWDSLAFLYQKMKGWA